MILVFIVIIINLNFVHLGRTTTVSSLRPGLHAVIFTLRIQNSQNHPLLLRNKQTHLSSTRIWIWSSNHRLVAFFSHIFACLQEDGNRKSQSQNGSYSNASLFRWRRSSFLPWHLLRSVSLNYGIIMDRHGLSWLNVVASAPLLCTKPTCVEVIGAGSPKLVAHHFQIITDQFTENALGHWQNCPDFVPLRELGSTTFDWCWRRWPHWAYLQNHQQRIG